MRLVSGAAGLGVREESHEDGRFAVDASRRGAFGCDLDITGYGSSEERCGRDGAIAGCLSETKRHYPGSYRDWDNVQSFSYRSCMHDAGYVD
jgi:hypothetical protein